MKEITVTETLVFTADIDCKVKIDFINSTGIIQSVKVNSEFIEEKKKNGNRTMRLNLVSGDKIYITAEMEGSSYELTIE